MAAEDRYEELEPAPALRRWLRCVWTYQSSGGDRRPQRITPDGCPELVLHLGSAYAEVEADGSERVQPRIVFAGQLTQPLALRPTGPVSVVAARFEPDGAWAWFGTPLTAATDQRVDVEAALPSRAAALVSLLHLSPARAVEGVQAAVAAAVDREGPVDPEVRDTVMRIEAGEPGPETDAAAQRRLQRRFLDRVGVSPRSLRSIVRFRRIFTRFREPGGEEWLLSALRAGYFDQPQMARDFRRFLGCTATEWAAEQHGLAHLIASQTYKTERTSPP